MMQETLRDCWTTPKPLAQALVAEFDLDIDVACSLENCVLAYRLLDGLAAPWEYPAWCNPPYSNIMPWCQNALASEVPSVLLLPARTASPWFRELVTNTRVSWWVFRGRVRFDPPEGIKASSPRHDSLLFHVHRHRGTGFAGVRCPKTGAVLQKANTP